MFVANKLYPKKFPYILRMPFLVGTSCVKMHRTAFLKSNYVDSTTLGQILTLVPDGLAQILAAQIFTTDFGGRNLLLCYPGEEESIPFALVCTTANPSPTLGLGQASWPPYSTTESELHSRAQS